MASKKRIKAERGVLMSYTLLGILKTLFCLNRWNVDPRVETWTEAENVALCCHVVYAAGKSIGLGDEVLHHAIKRTLFKSNYKYILSDISVAVRELIDENDGLAWQKIRADVDERIKLLFPPSTAAHLYGYFSLEGNYGVPEDMKGLTEDLVSFAKIRAALSECEINAEVFPKSYGRHVDNLEAKLDNVLTNGRLGPLRRGEAPREGVEHYLAVIRNLKHVRRWNRLNRFIESSVLAHTFIVAFLAVLFSEMEAANQGRQNGHFQYEAMVLALFHDVPEVLTGDIISPVKGLIEEHSPGLIVQMERQATDKLLAGLPEQIKTDMEAKAVLKEPNKEVPFSAPSLVKDCDQLAGMLECAFEMSVGNANPELVAGFDSYHRELQKSEWLVAREFSARIRREREAGLV